MNRVIKFRAWDKKEKRWLGNTLGTDQASYVFSVMAAPSNWKDYHFQQFTGLLDKNGKEIYEGDVVRMYLRDTKPEPLETVSSVFYSQGTFTAMALNGEPLPLRDSISISNKTGMGVEVIGNIYENPELLKDHQ